MPDHVEMSKKVKNFNDNISNVELIYILDCTPWKNKLCFRTATELLQIVVFYQATKILNKSPKAEIV